MISFQNSRPHLLAFEYLCTHILLTGSTDDSLAAHSKTPSILSIFLLYLIRLLRVFLSGGVENGDSLSQLERDCYWLFKSNFLVFLLFFFLPLCFIATLPASKRRKGERAWNFLSPLIIYHNKQIRFSIADTVNRLAHWHGWLVID